MIKVAIAEDDFRVAQIHEKFLNKIDDIEIVGNTRDASSTLEMVKDVEVDLLLLDIYFPDELGTSIIPKLRAANPEIDIIMITAGTDKHLMEDSVRHGVFYYLIKPVSAEQFIKTVQAYIDKRKLIKEHEEIDQSLVDEYFNGPQKHNEESQSHPKGIDSLTLKKVKSIMNDNGEGITAELMGEKMGASRTTARRYLEYLISVEEGLADLEYGIIGRPERKYYPK